MASGPRTVVELQEADQICSRFQSELSKFGACHTLDLSCRAWRVTSLKVLEPVLKIVVETVRHLKIDDIIASLPTKDGLESLAYLANVFGVAPLLSKVNLNDNAVGSRGIAALRSLLNNKSIVSLYFENCGLAEADGQVLYEILTADDRALRDISLSRNQMGAGGAEYIGQLLGSVNAMRLESFSYAGSRPLPVGTSKLCHGLAKLSKNCGIEGTRLHTLDLNDCTVGDESDAILNLCAFLKNSPRLHKLILRDTELKTSGLRSVLDSIDASGAAITHLDLGAIGELGASGGSIIRDFFLANGPTSSLLQELHLDTNELGDDGVIEAMTGIAGSCQALQVLDFSQNELVNIVGFLQHRYIPTLQNLKLDENPDISNNADLRILLGMYKEVIVDDDLEGKDDDDDDGGGDNDDCEADDNSVHVVSDSLEAFHI